MIDPFLADPPSDERLLLEWMGLPPLADDDDLDDSGFWIPESGPFVVRVNPAISGAELVRA